VKELRNGAFPLNAVFPNLNSPLCPASSLSCQAAEAEGRTGRSTPKKVLYSLLGDHDRALLMHCWAGWAGAAAERRRMSELTMQAYRHLYFALARRCFAVLR